MPGEDLGAAAPLTAEEIHRERQARREAEGALHQLEHGMAHPLATAQLEDERLRQLEGAAQRTRAMFEEVDQASWLRALRPDQVGQLSLEQRVARLEGLLQLHLEPEPGVLSPWALEERAPVPASWEELRQLEQRLDAMRNRACTAEAALAELLVMVTQELDPNPVSWPLYFGEPDRQQLAGKLEGEWAEREAERREEFRLRNEGAGPEVLAP